MAITADGQSWKHWKVTTQPGTQCISVSSAPEDSILEANLSKLVNARYKERV